MRNLPHNAWASPYNEGCLPFISVPSPPSCIISLYRLFDIFQRNFRCDCGNERFPKTNPCQLEKDKMAQNEDNRYNHNFVGVYCICARPYPDPEDPISDEMIQCVICEDWFHGRHLGPKGSSQKVPKGDQYSEMVCANCVQMNSFLRAYR
jgi:E3 ubiquitin-protein ligase UBR7